MASSNKKTDLMPHEEWKKRKDDEQNSDSSEEEEEVVSNKFANDGSFLEMFKRMQQQQNGAIQPATASTSVPIGTVPTTGSNDDNGTNKNNNNTSENTQTKAVEVCHFQSYFFWCFSNSSFLLPSLDETQTKSTESGRY